jgi:hypothetical protein
MAVGIRHADHMAPSIRKGWRSLGRYISLADSDHRVYLFVYILVNHELNMTFEMFWYSLGLEIILNFIIIELLFYVLCMMLDV